MNRRVNPSVHTDGMIISKNKHMKQKITILTAAIIMMATTLSATVWRVNNRTNVDADFTTLQDAIDGASDGDTLYIDGSAVAYGNGTFDKKLIVFGAGYWLEENDITQAYKYNSTVGQLVFNAGSQGSIVQGLNMYYASTSVFNVVEINTDSIIIERNYIYAYENGPYTYNGSAIYLAANTSDIIIRHNWIKALIYDNQGSTNGAAIGVYVAGIPEATIIKSNFIHTYKTSSYGSYYAIYFATNNPANELMLSSNVMWGGVRTYYTNHYDNILVNGSYNNGTGDESYNNLCDGTQYPDNNNNQQNVDMTTVFIDYVGYIDNDYILASGSPAIGAAMNGGDCGAFGDYPYILSGMPEIPAIFETTVIPFGTTSLPVNVKASSHN